MRQGSKDLGVNAIHGPARYADSGNRTKSSLMAFMGSPHARCSHVGKRLPVTNPAMGWAGTRAAACREDGVRHAGNDTGITWFAGEPVGKIGIEWIRSGERRVGKGLVSSFRY